MFTFMEISGKQKHKQIFLFKNFYQTLYIKGKAKQRRPVDVQSVLCEGVVYLKRLIVV